MRERERESNAPHSGRSGREELKQPAGRAQPQHATTGGDHPLLPTPVASEGIKATNRQDAEQKAKTWQVWLTNVAQTIRKLNHE